MANGIGGMLTQKLGPIPVWGWLAGGGIAVYLVASGKLGGILGGSTSGTGTTATTSPATGTAATSAGTQNAGSSLSNELGLLQQLQAFNQQSVQSYQQTANQLNPSTQSTANSFTVSGPQGASIFTQASAGQGQGVPSNTPLSLQGNTIQQGTVVQAVGNAMQIPWGNTQVSVTPVNYQGEIVYVPSTQLTQSQQAAATGVGGGSPGRKQLPANPGKGGAGVGTVPKMWRGGHALVRAGGAGPLYPHYAMGGPRNIVQVGALTHTHPARVLAANGFMKKGKAAPGQIVRVA